MTVIRVLIVDDHRVFAESVAHALGRDPRIEVVALAGSGTDGADVASIVQPDVVVLDYGLPDAPGATAMAMILDRAPRARVVVLTGSADPRTLADAIEAGCAGYVAKTAGTGEVVDAVVAAAAGQASVPMSLLADALPRLVGATSEGADLSPRELEVLRLMAEGAGNGDIADRLGISTHTARNHVKHVLTKLGAHSRLEAVTIAVRRRLVEVA